MWLTAGALHAAGPFSAILGGSGQDFALAVTSDPQGNVYVAGLTYSPDFPVTPGAVQTRFGGTCDAFVAKLGPDGKTIWATYLGGILDDYATGIAVDKAGNVLVTGNTRSGDFPLVHPVQQLYNNGVSDDYDAFVAKLDPNGATLIYSTFLGGPNDDGCAGIALDAAGDAYVAVNSGSVANFPGIQGGSATQFGIVISKFNPQGGLIFSVLHPYDTAAGIVLDAAGNIYVAGSNSSYNPATASKFFGPQGSTNAIALKLSPDGSKVIFETALGGSVHSSASAIAVDGAGEVYVAGSTPSVDFPLLHPLQSTAGGRPLWKSTDGGATWKPLDDLPVAMPQVLVVDPSTPATLYEATGDLGIFKSLDGGATWSKASSGIAATNVQVLTIDPVQPQTLYASTTPATGGSPSSVYKTVNGGGSWTLIDSPQLTILGLAVDPQNPNIVWEIANSLRRSTDGGASWNAVTFPGIVASLALDPHVSGELYASSNFYFCGFFCTNNQNPYIYTSSSGGANWTQVAAVQPYAPGLLVDGSTNPATVYDGINYRSTDGGVTWTPITPPPGSSSYGSAIAIDPSGTLYAAVGPGDFVSHDHGQTWTASGSLLPPPAYEAAGPGVSSLVAAGSTGTLYATLNLVSDAGFVTKLSADGRTILYSTYLRGHPSLTASVRYAAEPQAFTMQNWIAAIAVDAAGNATVAGGTRAMDFPVVAAAQLSNAGLADAFVTTIAADGSAIRQSSYFGGSLDDGALAATLDAQGNPILAGQSWSPDFPVPGGVNLPFTYGNAFVVRLAAAGVPSVSSVLNGASFQPGIEAGSWVAIEGANLANTFPGRTWRTDEVVNGVLPASLDGVSVTIDGLPAFVYYISPTQINVQAPSDSATGAVRVVVTNNGNAGAPATAQLQTAAPGFFQFPGTTYVIASRLPDFALVGPAGVAGTVAAKPGDTVVLWGTGFGPTNPPAAAGTAVSGAPAAAMPVTVTVGGVAAQVIDTVLTTGTAGLYQVTIRVPASAAVGAAPVTASVGGVQTQGGVMLMVGGQE